MEIIVTNLSDTPILQNNFGRKLYTHLHLKDRLIWQYLHRDKPKPYFKNEESDEFQESNFFLKVNNRHG